MNNTDGPPIGWLDKLGLVRSRRSTAAGPAWVIYTGLGGWRIGSGPLSAQSENDATRRWNRSDLAITAAIEGVHCESKRYYYLYLCSKLVI
jgi:hypothetical protein